MEKTLSLSEAKMKLNNLVDRVDSRDDEFVITKNGSPVAVLVPASLYEGWKETMAVRADPEFMAEIKRGVSHLRRKSRRFSFKAVFKEPIK